MEIRHHDISSLQMQLTIARWHLDASVYAPADVMRHHRARARHAYDSALRMLSLLQESATERGAFERELSDIRSRLDAA